MKSFYSIEELAYILNTNTSRLYKARAANANDELATKYIALSPRNTAYPCEAVIDTLIRLGNDREKAIEILNSLDSTFIKK